MSIGSRDDSDLYIYSVHISALNNVTFNNATWLPLHIGVPLFILIGGYWGIRVSGKRLRQLIEQMLICRFGIRFLFCRNEQRLRNWITKIKSVSLYDFCYCSFIQQRIFYCQIYKFSQDTIAIRLGTYYRG